MPEAATANTISAVTLEPDDRSMTYSRLSRFEEISNLSPWGWDAYHLELQNGLGSLMLVARLSPDQYVGA
jgi:hypothetical protein